MKLGQDFLDILCQALSRRRSNERLRIQIICMNDMNNIQIIYRIREATQKVLLLVVRPFFAASLKRFIWLYQTLFINELKLPFIIMSVKVTLSSNITMCPRSSDSLYIVFLLYKQDHYFLDIHYYQGFCRDLNQIWCRAKRAIVFGIPEDFGILYVDLK